MKGQYQNMQDFKSVSDYRFFKVVLTKNWIETPLDYCTANSHAEVAKQMPLPNKRITNDRYREIEQTGTYYTVTEQCKNGKAFIYETI